MTRAAVLGSPIAHSLSPVLHRGAYGQLGLDWSYEAVECDEQRLPQLWRQLDASWIGLSLTMPLKRAVLPLLDEVSELATTVGGANTVVFENGRARGENTDVGGMVDALAVRGMTTVDSAVILGAGATACSALPAVQALGAREVVAIVRDTSRTADMRATADRLEVPLRVHTFAELPELPPAELLVSTLPANAADSVAGQLEGSGAGSTGTIQPPAVLLDVCYDPWPTALAAAAEAAGSRTVGGFELLLQQAARQVALMTGYAVVPVEAMRAAGHDALAARAGSR